MKETAVTFRADKNVLQGLLSRIPGDKGVVITHPHSLYGGDMHNPVVETITRVYGEEGFSTLRFNFRGVGGSEGTFDNGRGERDDVSGAITYLLGAGIHSIELVGYSFGALVLGGMGDVPEEVVAQVHIAPPVALMDYGTVSYIPKLKAVIAAEDDDIGPPEQIKESITAWNSAAQLLVIEGGDHFFSSKMISLEAALRKYIRHPA